jgi:hypothetical protein
VGALGTNAFNNTNFFTKLGAGTVRFYASGGSSMPFNNSGTVEVQEGTLSLESGGSGSGIFIVLPGAQLGLSGGGFSYTGELVLLNGGSLILNSYTIEQGILRGNGTVTATDLINAGQIAPGLADPNQEAIGLISIDGDYQQAANGEVMIEVEDPNTFDKLAVSGNASLGGTLRVMLEDEADAPVGTVFEVMTTGGITGTFDDVITDGVDDIVLVPSYGASPLSALGVGALGGGGDSVYLTSFEEGDMDPFTPGIGEEDAVAFALALTDPDTYRNTYGISADEMGDIDDIGDHGLDFDDIDDFVRLLNEHIGGGMTMARMFQIIEEVQAVPEPSGLSLALGLCCFLQPKIYRRRYSNSR